MVVDVGVDVSAVSGRDHGRGGLILIFSPLANFDIGVHLGLLCQRLAQWQNHKEPRMALESLLEKRAGHTPGIMREQLRLHTVDAGRLLQRFNHVGQQAELNLSSVGKTAAVSDEQVANHALAAFIDEKRIAEDASTVDGGVAGQNLGIDVAQDHFRRPAVIPREQP